MKLSVYKFVKCSCEHESSREVTTKLELSHKLRIINLPSVFGIKQEISFSQ